MLLCDAAQEVGGKLYVLGGGWSVIWIPNVPTPVALAVKLAVPWDETNRPHEVRAQLLTEDGEPVDIGTGPMAAGGNIEVGRPPGLKPGTPIDVPFALHSERSRFRPVVMSGSWKSTVRLSLGHRFVSCPAHLPGCRCLPA
jgi:hypothetical protein